MQKRNGLPPNSALFLKSVFVMGLMIASTSLIFVQVFRPARADLSSFTFTAAGDYAQTNYAAANLQTIAASKPSFNLALGDFSYVANPTKTDADQWSNFVKSKLPPPFPFEILAGNHDARQMSNFVADLPDYLGATPASNYGKEYYFDYPPGNPLARFIMVSPGGDIFGYNYSQGTSHYNWVSQTIDQARNVAHIPWVIVGMHEYCLVMGTTQCGEGQDLMNLLLTKNVDLILQGHRHNYQTSKQLALNTTTCKTLPLNYVEPSCIVNGTTNMSKGAGSVTVIVGTGGETPLMSIPKTDPEQGYFRSWMASNVNQTWGITKFNVTATSLTEQFVPVTGQQGSGNFSDSFTITANGSTGTPTSTSSVTATASPDPLPTITPSTTPGATLAQDNFQRSNQLLWGKASDGQTWGANANSQHAFSINNHAGQVTASSNTSYSAILGPTTTNAQVKFSGTLNSFTKGSNLGAVLRRVDSKNFYKAYISGSALVIEKVVNGTNTKLVSKAFTATNGTSYTLLFSVAGNMLSASVWPTAGSGSWMVTITDNALSSGNCGLHMYLMSGVTATITSFQATSQ
jgi:hypothetical protein